jgi:hypothetical protein
MGSDSMIRGEDAGLEEIRADEWLRKRGCSGDAGGDVGLLGGGRGNRDGEAGDVD